MGFAAGERTFPLVAWHAAGKSSSSTAAAGAAHNVTANVSGRACTWDGSTL